MVVVLAAVLAYRRHLQHKREQQQQQAQSADNSAEETDPESFHQKYFQQAGSIRKSSTEFIQRAAFSCIRTDTTCAGNSSTYNSNSSSSSSHRTSPKRYQRRRRRQRREMSSFATEENGTSSSTTGSIASLPVVAATIPENQVASLVFLPQVRQEWINAVFGSEFFANGFVTEEYQAPRRGTGLSGIPDYVTYQVTIPPPLPDDGVQQKVGITLSKIALGVWVKRVEVGSEAHAAGVREGSILVSMNEMAMLAEPSKQALERLWQYEGHFVQKEEEESPILALKFIKDGQLYTCIFLSSPPCGISWAPCGNFALVQRSYSYAQAAGVKRGCLVAAINDKSMREMTHEGAAAELKQTFESGLSINMTLAYTPAASRTGHYERLHNSTKTRKHSTSPRKNPTISQEGIEVRVHPLEYSIGSFLLFGNQPSEKQQRQPNGVSELAMKVANGELEAPTGKLLGKKKHKMASMTCGKVYGSCPILSDLLDTWHAMDALVFLLKSYAASFQHDDLFVQPPEWGTLMADGLPTVLFYQENPDSMVGAYLIQFISMLCLSNTITESEGNQEKTRARFDLAARNVKNLAKFLLKLARGNFEFCQRFYFLLRSYTAGLELLRTPDNNAKDKDSQNISRLGLLQTLDLLQWTQKKLADQLHVLYDEQHSRLIVVEEKSDKDEEEKDDGKKQPATIEDEPAPIVGTSSSKSSDASEPKKGKKKKFRVFTKKASKKMQKEQQQQPIGSSQQVIILEKKKPSTPRGFSANKSLLSTSSVILPTLPAATQPVPNQSLSVSTLFQNMSIFLGELDVICDAIELSLMKSFSQKIADWALQPWSPTKETALANVTDVMREGLRLATSDKERMPLVNPMESCELLTSVDSSECYILPSAHFPLLLTFNVQEQASSNAKQVEVDTVLKEERIYRTRVEIVALRGSVSPAKAKQNGQPTKRERSYFVQGAVAGIVRESGRSPCTDRSKTHTWDKNNVMTFDTRSSWGTPRTLALRLSSVEVDGDGQDQLAHSDDKGRLHYSSVVGSCWVDLGPMWRRLESLKEKQGSGFSTVTCHAQMLSLDDTEPFDQHGELSDGPAPVAERLELELRVTTETLEFDHATSGFQTRKRMLLYKHDDDLRQEIFAIEFIKVCDSILKASGLNMKLLTFGCMPVGAKRGFIEWVPGSVPLSDICVASGILGSATDDDSRSCESRNDADEASLSEIAKAGFTKYQYFRQLGRGTCRGSLTNNPIQEYLRSVAYDSDAPYLIQKEVMDTYVKSCAGYCVITYLLGVGDRHLDNLLLHQSGHFFHCDYSFILGEDPKKYLPMRITEDMVHGMGGRYSDNYAMFLSLAGAAFVTFRRHENVRVLLSLVRLMAPSALPDVSLNRSAQEVLLAMRDRLRLDLSDDQAISFMEQLIETSISSKMWVAVDAMHSLGKRF